MTGRAVRIGVGARSAIAPWPASAPTCAARATLAEIGAILMPADAPTSVVAASSHRDGAVVAAVGRAARAAATLYAAALARPLVCVGSAEALWRWLARARFRSVFLIAHERWFTFERLDGLVDCMLRRQLSLGILPVPDGAEAAAIVAARLVALELHGRRFPRRQAAYSDYVPLLPARTIDGARFFGRDDVESFLAALGEGNEAVIVQTHSNGADFRLGRSVLCVQADALRPAPAVAGERCLPCHAGGPCLRAALRPSSFVGAAAWRTDIAVFLSCNVLLPHGALIEARFGYLDALFRGPMLRAAIASYTPNGTPVPWVGEIASLLAAGARLGEIAVALSRSQEPRTGSYVCVGDPEIELSAVASTGAGHA